MRRMLPEVGDDNTGNRSRYACNLPRYMCRVFSTLLWHAGLGRYNVADISGEFFAGLFSAVHGFHLDYNGWSGIGCVCVLGGVVRGGVMAWGGIT